MAVISFTGRCVNTASPPLVEFVDGTDPAHSWTFGFGADTVPGYALIGEYSTDSFSTISHRIQRTLTATDIAGTSFTFRGGDVPAAGNYDVRFYIADLTGRISDYSDTINISLVYGTDTTAPTLSSPTDAASGQTTANLSVSTDEANGTLYWVVTNSATPPSKAQVKAGQNHAGAAASDSDSQAIDATGVWSFEATGLSAGTQYYAYFMHEDAAGNQSTVSAGDGFTTTAAAPSLSSPTDAASGQTGADLGVTTDTANGVIYWVVTTSSTAPSAARVKLGQDHNGATAAASGSSNTLTTSGAKTFTASGLTANTAYYAHFMHEGATGGQSTVSSGNGFTTGLPDTYIESADGGEQTKTVSDGTQTFVFDTGINFGTADARRRTSLLIGTNGGSAHKHSTISLHPTFADATNNTNGTSLTIRPETGQSAATASTNYLTISDADIATGTTKYLRVTTTANAVRCWVAAYTHSRPYNSTKIEAGDNSNTTLSGTIACPAGGAIFALCSNTASVVTTVTWTGITEKFDVAAATGLFRLSGGKATLVNAATNRTISTAWFNGTDTFAADNVRLVAAAYGVSA